MENLIVYILVAAPIYQILLSLLVYKCIKPKEVKKADYVCNLSATTIGEVQLYDIPATALNHEVDTIPADTDIFVKEIRTMVDGRWYYIEVGSKVGFCKGNSLRL